MLQITVDMFSGRPNPTLVVETDEAKNLLEPIARDRSAIAAVGDGYQGLGYRGLILVALSDNVSCNYDVSPIFRIAHSLHPIGLEIPDRVFNLMRRAQVLDEGLHTFATRELQQMRSRGEVTEADDSAPRATPVGPGAAQPEA